MLRIPFALALSLAATPAFADRSDADACARKLSGLSLQTYQASVAKAERGATLRQAIGSHLKPLVESGKIEDSVGRKAGFQAAMCVRLVHR